MKFWFAFVMTLVLMVSSVSFSSEGDSEFDPFDPQAEQQLLEFDSIYEQETSQSPWLSTLDYFNGNKCYRVSCDVYAHIDKSKQTMFLYLNGKQVAEWKVSTGKEGRATPNFDRNPNGRIYDKYTSSRYPGGDYNGLGNMPYAVFIHGGFAIHGTPASNWSKLGTVASKGCVRLHPDHAKYFNRLVRKYGIFNTWITVTE